jgi:hypothetical protein
MRRRLNAKLEGLPNRFRFENLAVKDLRLERHALNSTHDIGVIGFVIAVRFDVLGLAVLADNVNHGAIAGRVDRFDGLLDDVPVGARHQFGKLVAWLLCHRRAGENARQANTNCRYGN